MDKKKKAMMKMGIGAPTSKKGGPDLRSVETKSGKPVNLYSDLVGNHGAMKKKGDLDLRNVSTSKGKNELQDVEKKTKKTKEYRKALEKMMGK